MIGQNLQDFEALRPNASAVQPTVSECASIHERTLAGIALVKGIGFVHGNDITLRILPASPGTGIQFVRTDLPGQPSVPAHFEHLLHQNRRTAIGRGQAIVEMTEHLLAPIAALGITSAIIEIDGDETPAGDGSSQIFLEAIDRVGTIQLDQTIHHAIVREPIRIDDGKASIEIRPPSIAGLRITYDLAYDHPGIGKQSHTQNMNEHSFRTEIAAARTFVLEQEVDALRAMGIGTRQTARDLIVYRADGTILDNQLRFPNECARHKLLDVVGDLALLGRPVWGDVYCRCSGHRHNVALVKKISDQFDEHQRRSILAPKAA